MGVKESSDFKSSQKGKAHYFCSASCKEKFDRKPEAYLK